MSYETNSKEKLLNFDNNKFFGIFNDNELSASFNFMIFNQITSWYKKY